MLVDALVKANGYLQISSLIEDPSEYWKVLVVTLMWYWYIKDFLLLLIGCCILDYLWKLQLDDTIIKTIETASDAELKEAKDLILRIRRRNLYQVFKHC